MNSIKSVLAEELDNSMRMLKRYRQAISALPRGSLVAKKIRGRVFYYLAYRQGAKVHFEYKGKLSAQSLADYKRAADRKVKYRALIADLKKQVVFIERALRERKRPSR